MAWIESHQTLAHHPKTSTLAAAWKCSLPAAVGWLHFLWWWALDYASTGKIHPSQRQLVARACHWRSASSRFWSGLIVAGFVDELDDEILQIHDWPEYTGRLLERRKKDAERKTQWRTGRGPDADSPADVRQTSAPAGQGRPAYRTQPTVPTGPEAGRPRARARGDGGFQTLDRLLNGDLPDEVRERLARPPIASQPGQPAESNVHG